MIWDPFKAFHSYCQYFKLLIINTLDLWKRCDNRATHFKDLKRFLFWSSHTISLWLNDGMSFRMFFFYCDKKCFLNICMSYLLLNALKKKNKFIISPYWVTIFKCLCINFLLHTSVFLIFKSCVLSDAGSMHHFNLISLSTTSEHFSVCIF